MGYRFISFSTEPAQWGDILFVDAMSNRPCSDGFLLCLLLLLSLFGGEGVKADAGLREIHLF